METVVQRSHSHIQLESVNHSEFIIGNTFWCGGSLWRCTDIGTRTIVAMRIDRVEVGTSAPDRRQTHQILSQTEAEAEGWFNGPPYAVDETVFDEFDIEGCSLEPDPDDEASTR